jgi:hypothetical protein
MVAYFNEVILVRVTKIKNAGDYHSQFLPFTTSDMQVKAKINRTF